MGRGLGVIMQRGLGMVTGSWHGGHRGHGGPDEYEVALIFILGSMATLAGLGRETDSIKSITSGV